MEIIWINRDVSWGQNVSAVTEFSFIPSPFKDVAQTWCRYWTTPRAINDVDPRNFTRKFTLFSFDKLWALTHWSRFYSVRFLEQSCSGETIAGPRRSWPRTQILMSLSCSRGNISSGEHSMSNIHYVCVGQKWPGWWLISWKYMTTEIRDTTQCQIFTTFVGCWWLILWKLMKIFD